MTGLAWFILGVGAGVIGVISVLERMSRDKPILSPVRLARCVPERARVSASTLVYGTTETYSHPRATELLRGAIWAPGRRT